MHIKKILAVIVLSCCILPAFGQPKVPTKLKGLTQARTLPSVEARFEYLRRMNPGAELSTIKSLAATLSVTSNTANASAALRSGTPASSTTALGPTNLPDKVRQISAEQTLSAPRLDISETMGETSSDFGGPVYKRVVQQQQTRLPEAKADTQPLPRDQRFFQLPEQLRTGKEVWEYFELSKLLDDTGLFTKEELKKIEEAFIHTDNVFYRDGTLITDGWDKVENAWDYMEQLVKELKNTFPNMTEKQLKAIKGTTRNMGLRPYGYVLSLQNYVLYYGKMPHNRQPLYGVVRRGRDLGKVTPVYMEMYGIFDQYRASNNFQDYAETFKELTAFWQKRKRMPSVYVEGEAELYRKVVNVTNRVEMKLAWINAKFEAKEISAEERDALKAQINPDAMEIYHLFRAHQTRPHKSWGT